MKGERGKGRLLEHGKGCDWKRRGIVERGRYGEGVEGKGGREVVSEREVHG